MIETDLEAWIHDLDAVKTKAPRETKKVIGKGLGNIKKTWKALWTGYAHIPHLPNAISYDVDEAATTSISGVVGPESPHEQWELGSIIEFGVISARAGRQNRALPGAIPSFALERPRFISAMEDIGERMLDGRL